MKNINRGPLFYIILLILAGEAVYILPYVLARVFRPTFLDVFELSNFQLGSLFSVYGTVALISYAYGGVIADKFLPRKLMALSLFLTALGGLNNGNFPIIPSFTNLIWLLGFYYCFFVLGSNDKGY